MERKYRKMHILFQETGSVLTIELASMKIENWLFNSTIVTNYKTSDECLLKFETSDGKFYTYEGYVPDFFPNKHYGDYIMISIDNEGNVQNFSINDSDIDSLLF